MTIVVTFQNPPIPVRRFDYCAYFDGEEEGLVGRGESEQSAVADLLAHSEHGEALKQALDALQCAANVLFLLEPEVKALGLRAGNVLDMVRAALPKETP